MFYQIHEVSRIEDTSTVMAIYAVERSGRVLTADEAVAALDVLNTQELAIILKEVVDVKAERKLNIFSDIWKLHFKYFPLVNLD